MFSIPNGQRRFYTVADAAYATGPAPSRAPRFRLKVYDAILLIIIVPTCRVYVPCAVHSLNLVGQSAVSCCLESVGFFGFVQGLYYFLVASTHRWKVVHNRLKKKGLPTVKRLSDTRWSAHAAAVKAVVKGYEEIKAGLKEIAADPELKGDTRKEALNHASNMDRLETGILTMAPYLEAF